MRYLFLLLLVPSTAFAGETLDMPAGTLRKECLQLREWRFWRHSCDIILKQIDDNGAADNEVIPVATDFYVPFKEAMVEWEREKAKGKFVRVCEAVIHSLHREHYWDGSVIQSRINIRWSVYRFTEKLKDIE